MILLLLSLACGALGCSARSDREDRRTHLSVWAHAGRESERSTLENQVERFNRQQRDVRVALTFLPEGSYNGQVQAAALAGDLPDVLELDGPYVANYAWQRQLLALDALLPDPLRTDLLPSILEQGTYADTLYAIGTFDSGLGLYGHREQLEAAGAVLPRSPAEAWTLEEFEDILQALADRERDRGEDGWVLDLGLNNSGEWFTYGFSPALQSAGGDLVGRTGVLRAQGVLDGPASVASLERIQSWIANGWVDPNLDDAAFVQGRVALSWTGHWKYRQYCPEGECEELVVLPLPDFGEGTRTGQGSWSWTITRECESPKAAMRFLEFLLSPQEILAMTSANHAVPATGQAIAQSSQYQSGGPLHLFAQQLREGYAVPRPRTPAYPIISSAFQKAFLDIRSGRPVQSALSDAARVIDRDIEDNRGYLSREELADRTSPGK